MDSAPHVSRDYTLAAVERDGRVLRHASAELRADKEVVLAAVQKNGLALEHASRRLRADREVVLTAVEQNDRALKFAPLRIRKLREEWPRVRLIFLGHRNADCRLSWLPAELVGGPLLAALAHAL